MILRNYYNAVKAMATCNVIPNALKDALGTTRNAGWYQNAHQGHQLTTFQVNHVGFDNANTGLIIGSGTTEPTYDDYKLESVISSGISASLAHSNGSTVVTITNSGNQSISISEVGIVQYALISNNSSNNSPCLIYRETFTPVVLAPNEVCQIIVKVDVNIPE